MNRSINTIIFDLGGVLIDWNPRYVYRNIFKTEQEIEWFLENVTTPDWNENQDAGYPLHKATEELVAKHPEWEPEIKAYYGRWLEMMKASIATLAPRFSMQRCVIEYAERYYLPSSGRNDSGRTRPAARMRGASS